jgi:hypothetical protein
MAADGAIRRGQADGSTRQLHWGEQDAPIECSVMLVYYSFRTLSEGTTARLKAVDHHDIQGSKWPVGASADQVQGIQRGTGWQQRDESEAGRGNLAEDERDAVRLRGRVLAGMGGGRGRG